MKETLHSSESFKGRTTKAQGGHQESIFGDFIAATKAVSGNIMINDEYSMNTTEFGSEKRWNLID